ncbi:hypothetical protein GGD66_007913 [Bradyrhizobium sp. CIR48]|uniref:hypothetical protein n=1 Tax=unclassified Bradyrhizobium TaxID=2631580 RepID=UPI00039DC32A|nr:MULTISPECIES: hypothetical protein [unclassified Bradyrhizobium]MBB4366178.1 hypothetical protein [Bradyrhizobium sp. CIR18]MBB4429311.1 hypothetical protein [Bradyrhizobium sp. CIR48]
MRLLSRNGTDWTKSYPWIAEAALKNRQKRFVIDGEAVILGVDGISDFNALHSRQFDHEVQLYAFNGRRRRLALLAPPPAQSKSAAAASAPTRRDQRGTVRTRRDRA